METFFPVRGALGYFANKEGQIATFDRCSLVNRRCYNGKVLKTRPINGYQTAFVCVKSPTGSPRGRPLKVHRMVAAAFYDFDVFDGCDVHHLDDNRLNNRLENLALVDPIEHRRHHGLQQTTKR